MDVAIRTISEPADQEAVARLRYQVFVRDMDRRPTGTDDELEQVRDPDDAISTVLGAFDGNELVACLRLTPVEGIAADSLWRQTFRFAEFPEPETIQVILSYLLVRSDRRDSTVLARLLEHAYAVIRDAGDELVFLLSPPNLVTLYEVLGCRRYTREGVDIGGLRLPMVMIAGDLPHFEAVKSPLLEMLRRYPADVSLGDWFDQQFPEFSRPSSQRAQSTEDFMRSFSHWINDASIPLLDDLDGEETTRLLASGEQQMLPTGKAVLRRGEAGSKMYLILEGAVEVSVDLPRGRRVLTTMGAGQLFGEGAFLLGTARSADVTTLSDSLLLALDTADFETLSTLEPAIAVKLLRNLCRMLCVRLYAGSAA
jgi:hypothetical protein